MVTQARKETKRDYVAEAYSFAGSWGLSFPFLFFPFVLGTYVCLWEKRRVNGDNCQLLIVWARHCIDTSGIE